MTQLKDGGCQPSNREERSLSASTVIARWQGNGWDEPCKSRGLRTVLWAAGGEIPPADPASGGPSKGPTRASTSSRVKLVRLRTSAGRACTSANRTPVMDRASCHGMVLSQTQHFANQDKLIRA